MASGLCAALKGRTHGRTDQCCKREKKSLPTRSRPHMGVKRTLISHSAMSASDPKRTFHAELACWIGSARVG